MTCTRCRALIKPGEDYHRTAKGAHHYSCPRPRVREADIEHAITDYLKLDGWRILKTDPVSRKEWAKGFGEKGMADVLAIRYCKQGDCQLDAAFYASVEAFWIEFKREGGKLSPAQEDWHMHERKLGALTVKFGVDCPASIEGFIEWYERSGLRRHV